MMRPAFILLKYSLILFPVLILYYVFISILQPLSQEGMLPYLALLLFYLLTPVTIGLYLYLMYVDMTKPTENRQRY